MVELDNFFVECYIVSDIAFFVGVRSTDIFNQLETFEMEEQNAEKGENRGGSRAGLGP